MSNQTICGREDSKLNDLFFLCSLIEYVARQTKNERCVVVNALGQKGLLHYYELAEVYHCENIDKVCYEMVNKYHIAEGYYDNVAEVEPGENVPTHWDIGKVMYRLVQEVAKREGKDFITAIIELYNSWIIRKIDNYNSSMYYENTSYQYACYEEGTML